MQYQIDHADLSLVLALVRGRSLARAAELLQVDVSTVFRAVRRLEAALGVALFEKSRRGYEPSETARAWPSRPSTPNRHWTPPAWPWNRASTWSAARYA